MKLNPLDSSLLTVIDGSQKVMNTLYKLSLTFCPDMVEQYIIITNKSYKVKKEDKDGNKSYYYMRELDRVPFTKLLFEYSKEKWEIFKGEINNLNDGQILSNEYSENIFGELKNMNNCFHASNRIIGKVYAGFLPNLELITRNDHYVSPPRIEIRRRYDPEIYSHLIHGNSFWTLTDKINNTTPLNTSSSVNEDPLSDNLIKDVKNKYFRTNSNYKNDIDKFELNEMGDNVRMLIDIDSAIYNLSKVLSKSIQEFFKNNKEEFVNIVKEMSNSGMFGGISIFLSSLFQSDSENISESELGELDSFNLFHRDDCEKYEFLIHGSSYLSMYLYASIRKYSLDKNYEFLKKLEDFVNIKIEEYIISVEISAIMTTAAWHNLYGGNSNFYKSFVSRIYNGILQLNAKEMRLFSKRHAINKSNPYVQNRDSISGRTIRNLTHNLHTLLTFLLTNNNKVDYVGIKSDTKKYETYGPFNKKIGLLVGTLINKISEFSSVISNNEKTIVGIKNQKFLVENTTEIGNRALSQIVDKGLRIKIQSLIENNNKEGIFASNIGNDDYLAMQNYMYTASVYKVVLIATLTYVSTLISENPNEMDHNFLKEDYYQTKYQASKDKLENAKNLLSKNFDKYDNSPWDYQCFPLGTLSDSFVIRDSYLNKKDYKNNYDRKENLNESFLSTIFEEINKKFNTEYKKCEYFDEIRDMTSRYWSMIGITSKEEKDFVFCALKDLLDDELLELHSDTNELDGMSQNLNSYSNKFDVDLSSMINIKNIPISLINNNTLTATESLDITLNLPLILQSLENVVYEKTSDSKSKEEFLNKLANLDAAYYRFVKKDIDEYAKR